MSRIHRQKSVVAKSLKTGLPREDTGFTADAGRKTADSNLNDAESLKAITPGQAPGLLRDFHAAAFRLFVTLRDLSELPPEKRPEDVKRRRDKRITMNWNAAHPAWNSRLDQARMRDGFINVSKASDWAWRSVELLADRMDGDDVGARRWSIAARLAILNSLPFGTSNLPGSFEVMCKLVRLYPAETLDSLRRRIDALNDCVTTVELFLPEPKTIGDVTPYLRVDEKWLDESKGEWLDPPLPKSHIARILGGNPRSLETRYPHLRKAGNHRQLWTLRLDPLPPAKAERLRQAARRAEKSKKLRPTQTHSDSLAHKSRL